MAEIEHGFALQSTLQTQPTGAWKKGLTVDSSNFVGGGKYLLIVTARVNGSIGAPNHFGFRVTNGGSVMLGSLIDGLFVFTASNQMDHYGYVTQFTAVAGQDIAFELQASASGNAQADEIAIFWMRLDASLPSLDYAFSEEDDSGAPVVLTGSYADFASITFTPLAADEDWLVIACLKTLYNVSTEILDFRINRDSDAEVAPFISRRTAISAGAADESFAFLIARAFTLSAASHTFKVQARGATGSPEHHSSRIFAIRLNAFLRHAFVWTEAGIARSGVFKDVASISLTPAAAANYLILGTCVMDSGTLFTTSEGRLRLDGVSVGQGSDSSPSNAMVSQVVFTDENPLVNMALESLSKAAHTIALQTKDASASGQIEDRSLVALSMQLLPDLIKPIGSGVITEVIPSGHGSVDRLK